MPSPTAVAAAQALRCAASPVGFKSTVPSILKVCEATISPYMLNIRCQTHLMTKIYKNEMAFRSDFNLLQQMSSINRLLQNGLVNDAGIP